MRSDDIRMRLEVRVHGERDTTEPTVDLRPVIGVFHRWIQGDALPELRAIDVVDYRHVHGGPGVVLLGHAGQLSVDHGDGVVGVTYRDRPRVDEPVAVQVRRALAVVLRAATLLEQDAALRLRLATDRTIWRVLDRLRAPDGERTLALIGPAIEEVGVETFAGAALSVGHLGGDASSPFVAVRVGVGRGAPAGSFLPVLAAVD